MPLCCQDFAGGIKTSKSFVDDTKVTDHHAIIPTEETPLLSALSDGERKIYDLVVRRFLAVFLPSLCL
jgi:DNA topoisomerase III